MADTKVTSEEVAADVILAEQSIRNDPDLVVAELLDIGKHVAWDGGYSLTEVAFKQTQDGWLVVIKATRRGKPWVAFVGARSYENALRLGAEWAYEGLFKWKQDDWPSEAVKKRLGLR